MRGVQVIMFCVAFFCITPAAKMSFISCPSTNAPPPHANLMCFCQPSLLPREYAYLSLTNTQIMYTGYWDELWKSSHNHAQTIVYHNLPTRQWTLLCWHACYKQTSTARRFRINDDPITIGGNIGWCFCMDRLNIWLFVVVLWHTCNCSKYIMTFKLIGISWVLIIFWIYVLIALANDFGLM